MNGSSARNKSILATIGILIFACLFLFVIIPSLSTKKPSDCKTDEVYNSSTKQCRAKTEQEINDEKLAKLEKEVTDGKQNGTICLTAEESWRNVGKTTCVVFYPEYFYRSSGGYLFIDEKENYRSGFVTFFAYQNMVSWDDFIARYKTGSKISVYGTIVEYEGHPEIKIYSLSQITKPQLVNCETSYGCVYKQGAQL